MNKITEEKLNKYFEVTTTALNIAANATKIREEEANIIIDMAQRYLNDAHYFKEKNNWVLAFAALNYAHGWLDTGARLKIYLVDDDQLFTVDLD